MKSKIKKVFSEKFGEPEGTLYASAGRINLIGEHTDYNGGFVFPGAIDKVIMAEIRPNGTDTVRAFSIDIDDYAEFGLREEDAPQQSWARYIFGICREIIKRGGKVGGFDTVFAGNVPLGAGLSSSAALESCFAFGLNDLFNDGKIDKFELVLIGQATEHNYCGVNCGISEEDFKRAKFVIEEKDRVMAVCDALVEGDYETVGKKMYETHAGLSKDYEVSCEELDFLNDVAKECGVTGSRIMGGGFGGCTINLVKDELHGEFIDEATSRFKEKYGHAPKIYDVIISDGARKISE